MAEMKCVLVTKQKVSKRKTTFEKNGVVGEACSRLRFSSEYVVYKVVDLDREFRSEERQSHLVPEMTSCCGFTRQQLRHWSMFCSPDNYVALLLWELRASPLVGVVVAPRFTIDTDSSI